MSCCFWEFLVTSPRDEASKIAGATFLVRRLLLLQEILQYNSNSPQRTSAMPPS
jgi:hypothetical protein